MSSSTLSGAIPTASPTGHWPRCWWSPVLGLGIGIEIAVAASFMHGADNLVGNGLD